jgi:segregation and condensation protein B
MTSEEEPTNPAAESELIDGQVTDAAQTANEANEPAMDVDVSVVEALLLSTHHPLTAGRLAELMELPGTKAIRKAIKSLNEQYEQSNRSFRIEQVAGGYQILTLPKFGEHLKRLHQKEIDSKLTKAALETLAIVAY